MWATVVRRCSSAAMPLRLSNSTPIPSSPIPSTVGPRPTATSIRSASTDSASPKWTRRPSPVSSTPVHCLSRCSAIPRFLNCLASSFAASSSSAGISRGSISMMVTSEPKRRKMDANSQPMIPPPSTTSRRGTSVCASKPVESTQRGESRPGIGGASGNDPVAMTAERNCTSSPPSTAIVFASLKRPVPFTHSLAVPKSSCLAHLDAQLREGLLGLLDRERRLDPRLRRDAPDPQAGPAELRLLLDADGLRAELGRADRSGVPAWTATENSDVALHEADPSEAASELGDHGRRVPSLVDRPEAEALVEPDRRVVLLDAEAEPREAVLPCT